MQPNKDYQRLQSLYNERLLQIKRQGIIVQLHHRQQILPAYIQCTYSDINKLEGMLDSKMSLELCDLNGVPLMKIGKKCYFTRRKDLNDQYRVYMQSKGLFRYMREGPFYILVKNNATIGVLSEILQKRLTGDRYFEKIENFIGDEACTKIDLDEDMCLDYEEQSDLNQEQNLAIKKSFTNHLTFVKGPPGCGKTKTVSRMVKMLAERGLKVLVGSISNIANQTLISEIVRQSQQHNYLCDMFPQPNMRKLCVVINYSRKALQKISEQAKCYSINNQLYYYILHENNSDHYHEDNVMQYIDKLQQGETVPNSFWAIYMKSYTKLISDANIVISTTVNSFKLYKYTGFRPNVGIVDEAAQASWTDTYGFLAFGVTRMVFVGDEKQLRPTVIGDCSWNDILKETMFEKLALKNQEYFVHLVQQYRMHPKISEFANYSIYEGRLVNSPTTNRETSLQYFRIYPISFVTHNFIEQVQEASSTVDSQKGVKQFYNQYEGSLIMDFLFSVPLQEWKNIGILTFYDMQCQVLIQSLESQVENFLSYGLTIKTVDGYQGGQKDYILVSTVRSNVEKNPGFCTQVNRVNVAMTRAKKGLIVFGDAETLTQGKSSLEADQNIWGTFYNFMVDRNQVLQYKEWHQIIVKIKNKQNLINHLYHLYTESLKISQEITTPSSSSNEKTVIHQMNELSSKQAQQFLNEVKNSEIWENQNDQDSKQISHQKIISFFAKQPLQHHQNQQSNLIFITPNQTTFTQKVLTLINNLFTYKQLQFACQFMHLISQDLYEIISKPHQSDEFTKLLTSLKTKIIQEQHKLIKCGQMSVRRVLKQVNQESPLDEDQNQVIKTLVSSKSMYQLVKIYQNEIQSLVVQWQATTSD